MKVEFGNIYGSAALLDLDCKKKLRHPGYADGATIKKEGRQKPALGSEPLAPG